MKNIRSMLCIALSTLIITVMVGCSQVNTSKEKEASIGEQFGQGLVDSIVNSVEQSMQEKIDFSYPVKKEFREQQIHKLINELVSEHLAYKE